VDIFWTVLAGVSVFVLGQMAIQFLIEPFRDYRDLVGRIAHATVFYQNVTDSPGLRSPATVDEGMKVMRGLAAELPQRAYAIPAYRFFATIRLLPKLADIQSASSSLIGYSNSLDNSHADLSRISRDVATKLRFVSRT